MKPSWPPSYVQANFCGAHGKAAEKWVRDKDKAANATASQLNNEVYEVDRRKVNVKSDGQKIGETLKTTP